MRPFKINEEKIQPHKAQLLGFLGDWEKSSRPWANSLCYPDYLEITDDEFERAQGSVFYGLDLGYGGESPSALVAGKLVGKNFYLKEMIYQDLSLDDLANTMLDLKLHRDIIICDSANPAFIKELKRRGLSNIMPAVKPKIEVRVALMRDNCNIKITKSSRFLIGEIKDYHYLEDAKGVATDKIAPRQNDHALDAAGYLFLYLQKQGQSNKAIAKEIAQPTEVASQNTQGVVNFHKVVGDAPANPKGIFDHLKE